MHRGTQAYRAVAKEIASPRELEATLLLKAAARLQAVIESWDKDKAGLTDALLYNRKLWTVFLGSAMSADNPLPTEIRQNVANLGMYIMSQTIAVSANPRIEVVSSLVTINRELAAGLRARAGA
jgi:flagellar protein FlaF